MVDVGNVQAAVYVACNPGADAVVRGAILCLLVARLIGE